MKSYWLRLGEAGQDRLVANGLRVGILGPILVFIVVIFIQKIGGVL